VESKWENYHITTFPGQSLSKTGLRLEEATDLSRDRLILDDDDEVSISTSNAEIKNKISRRYISVASVATCEYGNPADVAAMKYTPVLLLRRQGVITKDARRRLILASQVNKLWSDSGNFLKRNARSLSCRTLHNRTNG
jgi:hypothetical protein